MLRPDISCSCLRRECLYRCRVTELSNQCNVMFKSIYIVVASFLFITLSIKSQTVLTLKGQLRTRTELRDGYATLNDKESKPAFFTSQRGRITAGLSNRNLEFRISLQDVRLWGQDASTINGS